MARIVTVEGYVEALLVIEDAEDDDDARDQAKRLFREHLTFDTHNLYDFILVQTVSQEEATEVVNDEE